MSNRSIIKRAYRMIGVLGSGREPSNGQATDALEALQSMVLSIPAFGDGGSWVDQDVTEDVTADENDRIRVNSTTAVTVTLPVSTTFRERLIDRCGCITIWATCTNERAPKDGAKVWITDVYGSIEPRLYLYRADTAEWVLASALTLDGPSAFNASLDQGLAAMLAVIMAAETAQPVPPQVQLMAQRGEVQMGAMFGPDMTMRLDMTLWPRVPFNIITG